MPESKRYYKDIICFDMESILAPISPEDQSGGRKLVFIHEHKPVSVSVCSNIPGYQRPYTIINSNTTSLVNGLFEYFYEIRDRQQQLAKEKWYPYYDELLQKINNRLQQKVLEFPFYQTDDEGEDSQRSFKQFLSKDLYLTQLLRLAKKFQRYVSQCVIIGFNNGGYDNLLIRGEMIKYLCKTDEQNNHRNLEEVSFDEYDYDYSHATSQEDWEEEQDLEDDIDLMSCMSDSSECSQGSKKGARTIEEQAKNLLDNLKVAPKPGKLNFIKRVNKYLSISNSHWSILDIMNFLSPGTSYSRFLSSFDVEEKKFFFPYEKLSSVDALREPLPSYSDPCWFSQIKGAHILHGDYEAWELAGKQGDPPPTGEENYQMIERVWREKGFRDLSDLLTFYNEIDVKPMIEATRKLLAAFHQLKLDALKISVSLPGLARKIMYRYAEKNECSFPLVKPKDSDWLYKLKANLTAGPSIIFQRQAIKGVTPIRPGSKELCQRVTGFDQNSMYAYCIAQDVPCYTYCRRFSHESFKPHFDRVYPSMYVWMKQQERLHNVVIHTRMSAGFELRIGSFFCDGYSLDQSGNVTIWEYMGCFHHSCRKCPAGMRNNRPELYQKTMAKIAYLESLNYCVRVQWECEFISTMRNDPSLMSEYRKYKPEFLQKYPKQCTEADIIAAIRNDEIFGFVMCSVKTPPQLRDRFRDFPPLFGNVNVEYDIIGQHMQEYCQSKGVKYNKPRRMLVSGLDAENMLFSTDLLAYYMRLGLVVYDVTEITEYCRSRPFRDFIDLAAQKRRETAQNKKTKVIGDMYKLLMNASYGSTLMAKEKFTHVQVVSCEKKARLSVNNKSFKGLQHLGHSYYEIEQAPRRVVFDLNEIIGFQILQLAKRELLRIVYDFFHLYLQPALFAPILCDTDSAYICMARDSLDAMVRPEMRDAYRKQHYERCGDRSYDGVILPLCCSDCKAYFRFSPGFYKVEFEGEMIVALAAKTYVACNLDKSNVKLSSKGCQKRRLMRNDPMAIFSNVLETKESHVCDNYGFRLKGMKMMSYHQRKIAASYLYVKRQVLSDGRNTIPLDLVLTSSVVNAMCLQTHAVILSPDHVLPFTFQLPCSTQISFLTIFQAYTYMLAYENLSAYARTSVLSDILLTVKCEDLLKIQKLISTKYEWESEKKHVCLKAVIEQRFEQNRAKCEEALAVHIHLDILNNTPCRLTGTGVSPLTARWRRDYRGSGRNYIGEIYQELRERLIQ